MISFDENTIAAWMIPLPPDRDCLYALLWVDDHFEVVGRLRTYNPASTNPFDGKDKKQWVRYAMRKGATRDETLKACREVMARIAMLGPGIVDEVMASTPNEWVEKLQAKEWIHVQAWPARKGEGN